tara:strand:- start:745 stop:1239 length:495 start_codon:yes stop_codon:yes gene_type:complete
MKRIFGLLLLSFCFNAEVLLVDGSKLVGEIISSSDTNISIKLNNNNQIIEIDKNKILDIDFNPNNLDINVNTKMIPAEQKNNNYYNNEFMYAAGKDLQNFRSQYFIGAGCQALGTLMLANSDNIDDASLPFMLMIGGTVAQFMAFNKIGAAGEKLELEAKANKN